MSINLHSEYIARIQELIKVVGDVEVIIEKQFECGVFEPAQCETQNCIKLEDEEYDNLYTDDYNWTPDIRGVFTFIKV